MFPYFFLFFSLSLFSIAEVFKVRREQLSVIISTSSLLLVFFAAFRFGDQDYFNYVDMFEQAANWDLNASVDIGFSILLYLTSIFTTNSTFMFFVVALLSVTINIKSYNDYCKYALVAILFYFVHSYALKDMIQIRAGLACALGLYNVRNLGNNRIKAFILIQCLAMSIHLAAIMYCIPLALHKINFTRKNLLLILSGCFIIGTICPLGSVMRQLPMVSALERIQTYGDGNSYTATVGILTNLATIKQLCICLLLYLYYDKLKLNILHFELITSMYFMSTCWLMLWNDFVIIGARMATFLSVGEPIIIASLLTLVSRRTRPAVTLLLIIVAYTFLSMNLENKILPYQFNSPF